jgi:hypothetical protein
LPKDKKADWSKIPKPAILQMDQYCMAALRLPAARYSLENKLQSALTEEKQDEYHEGLESQATFIGLDPNFSM